MSRFNPINVDQDEYSGHWFASPSAIPRLIPHSYYNTSTSLTSRVLSLPNPGQAASTADINQSVQQTERPWMQRILRGPQEPLDFYIARLETECSNNPRPVQAQGESRDEYAQRLWLRVYNKYCKRRSRRNERANYTQDSHGDDNDDNRSRHRRNQQRSQSLAATPSHGGQRPANVDNGHNNGQQQPPFRSHNGQEDRAGTDALRRLQARAAAGTRLQEHIREQAQQGVNMEQFFRSTLEIPSHEAIFDGNTMRFHGSFAGIAGFTNSENDGARLVLQPDQSNTGLPSPPRSNRSSSPDCAASGNN